MSSSQPATARFTPSGVITLTTDFGHKDPFVGVMKGQVLRRFPTAQLVDLTHEVLVHWPAEAGFWLGRSFRYFPAGTVHVAVVDPGVGSSREIAIVEAEGQVFLAPDNGLLAGVLERLPSPPLLRLLDLSILPRLDVHRPSATFHGRDIFAPLAAELAAGRLEPDALGPTVAELVPGWLDEPVVSAGQVSGAVVTVDHFGNLLTNIDATLLPRQMDRSGWPGLRKILTEKFRSRTRDEWCEILEGTDVCFAPVLGIEDAYGHAHNRTRGTFVEVAGVRQPGPAPRFSRTPGEIARPPAHAGEHSDEALSDWGLSRAELAELRERKALA